MHPWNENAEPPRSGDDESMRLDTLSRLGLINATTEPAFDRVTRLAARFLKVPVSLVSFADADRVYFKSRQGAPESWGLDRPAPRSGSICSVVLTSTEPLVINDTREHEEVKNLTPVIELGVAAYLGIPLVAEGGHLLGSLCAIDTRPRDWTTEEVATLQDLAGSVMTEVQLRAEIAERTQAESDRTTLQANEAEVNRRADRILTSITDGFFALDRDWRFTYLNPQAEPLLKQQRDALLGQVLWDVFPEMVGSQFDRMYRQVLASHQAVSFEEYYPPLTTWFEVHVYPSDDGLAIYFRDISERHQAEQTIREAEERFRVLLEGARDHALILMDMDGVILEWQGGAEQILGWTKGEAIGQPGSIIFTPEDRANQIDRKEFARAAEAGVAIDIRWHLKKDGSTFFADGVMTRLNHPDGQIRGFAKVFQDATARKVAEDTLHQHGEALKQADLRKNEFLAMLAHELRNPLAAIRNALGVARSGLQADLDWSLEVIDRQMRGFTHLIDDLLDVSRITQGKIQLRKMYCDATPIIRHAAEAVTPLIAEKQHTLMISVPVEPIPIEADRVRLEQILVNILTNAAKYTQPHGRIELTAQVEGDDVVIRVRDNGVGIPADQLPRMFELFAQADRSLARSEGGLGIGLTLVRSLTEMHGGTITAASAGKDRGSEFTLRLPAAAAGKLVASPTAQPASELFDAPKMRVLVVDDNHDTARGMARLLKIAGHEVKVAHDGWAAIEVAREFTPEAVLLDIGLPGLDGYEVATRLRHDESCQNALLIAASGYGEDQARDRSRKAGFHHHLTKPVDFDAITTLLKQPTELRPNRDARA